MSAPLLTRERLAEINRPSPFVVPSLGATVLLRRLDLREILGSKLDVPAGVDEDLRGLYETAAIVQRTVVNQISQTVDPRAFVPFFADPDDVITSLPHLAIKQIAEESAKRSGLTLEAIDEGKDESSATLN